MLIVLKDALYGAVIFGLLSFLNEKYKNSQYFSKISGFLVGAPTGYFLALLIFFISHDNCYIYNIFNC